MFHWHGPNKFCWKWRKSLARTSMFLFCQFLGFRAVESQLSWTQCLVQNSQFHLVGALKEFFYSWFQSPEICSNNSIVITLSLWILRACDHLNFLTPSDMTMKLQHWLHALPTQQLSTFGAKPSAKTCLTSCKLQHMLTFEWRKLKSSLHFTWCLLGFQMLLQLTKISWALEKSSMNSTEWF